MERARTREDDLAMLTVNDPGRPETRQEAETFLVCRVGPFGRIHAYPPDTLVSPSERENQKVRRERERGVGSVCLGYCVIYSNLVFSSECARGPITVEVDVNKRDSRVSESRVHETSGTSGREGTHQNGVDLKDFKLRGTVRWQHLNRKQYVMHPSTTSGSRKSPKSNK